MFIAKTISFHTIEKSMHSKYYDRVYISFFVHITVFYMSQMPTTLSKIMERI